jgi:small subunit ribosomal protein S17
MDKTAVVEMVWKQRDRLYRKQVRRVARYMVHDPLSQCQLGDVVRIQETRPISKSKHWRLLEILERREVAEVRPIELEADAEDIDEEEVEEEVLDLLEEGGQDDESEEGRQEF